MIDSKISKCSWANTNSGLLVLRLGVGITFMIIGYMKLSNMQATVTMFSMMGFHAFWAYVAAFAETFGGLFVLIGFNTRTAAIFLAAVMVVAIYVVHRQPSSIYFPMSLFVSSVALILSGGGKYVLGFKKK